MEIEFVLEADDHGIGPLLLNGLQSLAILVGALWAYFRFRSESPLHPRIEFDIDCKFLGPQNGDYLAGLTIFANNKGSVEHKFEEIRIRIRGIKKGAPLTEFAEYPSMVNFPEKIIVPGINIVPDKYEYFFVRPGVHQRFNYAVLVDADVRFIIVRAGFKYQDSKEVHTSERVFEVKE